MRLIYRRGRENVAFPIEEGETYIGRKEYCELYFPDGSLSKRHARLVRRGNKLKVFDAGSRNGTLVNGEPVDEARLREGDVIQCGKLQFKVAGVDGGSQDYDYVDERASRASKRGSNSLLVTARAVASVDARPSMLDVLPELPPSVEGPGYKDSLVDDPYEEPEDEPEQLGALFRLTEGGPPKTWDLGEETITIGSKEENAIVLTGDGVSRYHAEVVFEDGVWIVKDLGARNGLFVAGEKVDIYELKDGDEIQIGSSRLRFEVKKADPLAEVKKVAKAFLADPKGTLKTDGRARIALIVGVFVIAFLLLTSLGPRKGGGTGPGERTPPPPDWITKVSDLMLTGRFGEARTECRKAKAGLPPLQQKNPRHLEKMCNLWATLEGDPAGFSWDKAERHLDHTNKLKGIPPPLRDWFTAQGAFVKGSKSALKATQEARGMAGRAERLIGEGELEPALELLASAQATVSKVPSGTPFSPEARKTSSRITRTAFRALIREANKVTAQTPDWGRGLKLLEKAKEYAEGDDDRKTISKSSGTYERNWKDEQAYMSGVDIIQQGQPERYDRAREYFKQVHPRSRVFRHAVAYLEWIDADDDVRQAQIAYDAGDHRRAFQLLSDAFNHESLDKPAKESVKQLHTQWSRVVRAIERGTELKNANKYKEAIREFEQVLQAEPNGRNALHVRARAEIELLKEIDRVGYERKLKNLHSAYKKEDWRAFHTWAGEVSRDKNRRKRDVQWIFKATEDANKRLRLYKRCYRAFQRLEEDKYIWCDGVLQVLANWLPRKDDKGRANADRKKSAQLWTKIKKQIKRWEKLREGRR